MILRPLLAFTFLFGAVAVSTAQTVAQIARDDIQQAYLRVREAGPTVRLVVRGTEGASQRRYRSEIVYRTGTRQWIEVREFSGSDALADNQLPERRWVIGDGTTMWVYDLGRREYSAYRYGPHSGNPGNGYIADFMQTLQRHTRGQSAPGARVVSEIFTENGPLMQPWIPGLSNPVPLSDPAYGPASPVWPPADTDPGRGYLDPVMPSLYAYRPTDRRRFWHYYEPTLQRTVTFEITNLKVNDADPDLWTLTAVYSADRGAGAREWEVQITSNYTATMTSPFTFAPPRGSRPLSGGGVGG